MDNIVAVDLQALCCPNQSGVNADILSNVLHGINSIKQFSFLFREEVGNLFDYQDPFITSIIWALLANADFELYDGECLCSDLTVKPDISNDCADAIKGEMTLQYSFFHRNGIQLFIGFFPLWKADKKVQLTTIRDNKAIGHPTCIIENLKDWEDCLSAMTPCLVQLKHTAKEYQRGSTPVASFSSYNSRDEQTAKDLLQQAYADYQGQGRFPKHLYTWDPYAGLYVKFNNSGKNEYHGYDLKEAEWLEVPSYIRDCYHH